MKKITKIKISKEEQTLKKYLLTVNKISQLNKTKKTLRFSYENKFLSQKSRMNYRGTGSLVFVCSLGSRMWSRNHVQRFQFVPSTLSLSPWNNGDKDHTVIGPDEEYCPNVNSIRNIGIPTKVNMMV